MDVGELLTAYLKSFDPIYTGEGDGKLVGLIGTGWTIEEIITLAAIDPKHFTVVGSVSGALGMAKVGSAFTSSVAHFKITAGPTPWAERDVIQFVMTPPGTLRSAGKDFTYMQSDHEKSDDYCGSAPTIIAATLFRNTFAAHLRGIRRRNRSAKWN